MENLRIGIDLDNTIIDYSKAFYRVALNLGWIPEKISQTKNSVKQYLTQTYGGDRWTELQGHVYGPEISQATPYLGSLEFIRVASEQNIPLYIISHKSRFPARGPQTDLRDSALQWLKIQNFFSTKLSPSQIFFCDTRIEKIQTIIRLECTHFIDDLPEVYNEPEFPSRVVATLFDPENHHNDWIKTPRVDSWNKITKNILSL